MERDVFTVMQLIQLVAHVLEQEPIFLRINFESSFQQSQDELDASHRDHTALMNVNDVPSVLEVSDVSVGQQRIFFVGVEQGKVLHDNSCMNDEQNLTNCQQQIIAMISPTSRFNTIYVMIT